MRVLVLSEDKYFIRKAELELSDTAELFINRDEGIFDAVIYDADSSLPQPDSKCRIIKLSRNEENSDAISLPIPRGALKSLLADKSGALLTLSEYDKSANLKGRKISLTSHEYALLSLLISGGEEYTSRDTISKTVWKDAKDGLINIYIHYLREKLETDGEKIILSSRKYGYKINGQYINTSEEGGAL